MIIINFYILESVNAQMHLIKSDQENVPAGIPVRQPVLTVSLVS